MDVLRDKVDEGLIALVAIPFVLYSVHLTQLHFFSAPESVFRTATIVVAGVVGMGWMTWRLLRLAKRVVCV